MRSLGRVGLVAVALSLIVGACTSSGGGSAETTGVASTATHAATAADGATPENPSEPTAAPVPLLLYHMPSEQGTVTGQIWVVGADGSGRRKIADGVQASWRSDGRVIHVVTWNRDCVPSITDYPVDGGPGEPVVASLKAGDSAFSWSPDDYQVVFFRQIGQVYCEGFQFGGDPRAELREMTAGGGNQHQIVASLPAPDPVWWSPDGESVIVDDRPIEDTGPLKLVGLFTGGSSPVSPSSQSRFGLKVSPDGSRIAYGGGAADPQVYLKVANLDGSSERDLGSVGEALMELAWSPDGSQVAALADGVIVIRTATGARTTACPLHAEFYSVLAWSADSTSLATLGAAGEIVVARADGGGSRSIPGTEGVSFVAWQPPSPYR
jgi:WD40 repeat protein